MRWKINRCKSKVALAAEASLSFPHQFPCSLARVCREKSKNRAPASVHSQNWLLRRKNNSNYQKSFARECFACFRAYMRLRVLLSLQTPPPRAFHPWNLLLFSIVKITFCRAPAVLFCASNMKNIPFSVRRCWLGYCQQPWTPTPPPPPLIIFSPIP